MLLHNKDDKQITHYHFLLHIQATTDSCCFDSYCEHILKCERSCSTGFFFFQFFFQFFFDTWVSFNSHSQLPLCYYSSPWLCSLLSALCKGDQTLVWASIQGLYFLGDWFWKKKTCLVIPKCFPCLWGEVAIVPDPRRPARFYIGHAVC